MQRLPGVCAAGAGTRDHEWLRHKAPTGTPSPGGFVAGRLDERVLVLRCQARDEAAFAEMVARSTRRLRYDLLRMLGSVQAEEDALQEVRRRPWLPLEPYDAIEEAGGAEVFSTEDAAQIHQARWARSIARCWCFASSNA